MPLVSRLWRRARSAKLSSPAIRTNPATLTVGCYASWQDLDESLSYLTPGGRGKWGDVQFTTDTSVSPDWFGFFNHGGRKPFPIKASPNRVFFAIGEPPTPAFRHIHTSLIDGTFVLTCDEGLVRKPPLPRRYVATPVMTRTWHVRRTFDELHQQKLPDDKPGVLSWITSNKDWMRGHRVRMEFLDRLRGKVDFDLYGEGFRPVSDKWDALAPYRYSIAFENSRFPLYFTEKVMDCFVSGAMPIYCGSPTITDFFPAESMVLINPDDPDVFAKINDAIKSDLWRRRRDAIEEAKRLVLEKYNIFAQLAKFVTEISATSEPLPQQKMNIRYISTIEEDEL